MAESAIRRAEEGDFSEVGIGSRYLFGCVATPLMPLLCHQVELLHRTLSSPFVTQDSAEEAGYAARPPLWANGLKVSCSS